jgi:hypothetical protein
VASFGSSIQPFMVLVLLLCSLRWPKRFEEPLEVCVPSRMVEGPFKLRAHFKAFCGYPCYFNGPSHLFDLYIGCLDAFDIRVAHLFLCIFLVL